MIFKFASNLFQIHFKFISNPLQFSCFLIFFYKFVTFIIFSLFQIHFRSQQINSLQNDVKFGDVPLNDITYLHVRYVISFEVKNSIFSQQPQHEIKVKRVNIKKTLVLGKDMSEVIMIRSLVCSCG